MVRPTTFLAAVSALALALSPAQAGAARLSSKTPILRGSPSPPANPPAVLIPKGGTQSSVGKMPGSPAPPVPTPFPNLGRQGSSTDTQEPPKAQWNFENAWPSKVSGPQPKSDSNELGVDDVTIGPKSIGPPGATPASSDPEHLGRVKVKFPSLPDAPPEKMTAPEGPVSKVEVRGWNPVKKEEIKGTAETTNPPQAEMFNPTELSIKKTVPWDKPK